jgi:two-component system, cell cycle response regulator DivK
MPRPTTAPKLILIVEDDPDGVETLTELLSHEGYRLAHATNGQTGITLAQARVPDLIIMDLGLPEMDGWEATRRLKAAAETAFIPILVVSAHVFEVDKARAAAAGADAFLPKPSELETILAAVQRLIGRPTVERHGA